jgi:hypothetical protein
MEEFKLIVAGSRSFNDYQLLKTKLDFYLSNLQHVEIVSGTARGADQLGERYAREKGFSIKRFPADWSLGKVAGYLRNKEMAEYANGLVAFWDGKSRGDENDD